MNSVDRKTVVALALIALATGPLIFLLKDVELPKGDMSPLSRVNPPAGYKPPSKAAPPVLGANGTSVQSMQSQVVPPEPQKLVVEAVAPAEPSLILDVAEPGKLLDAAQKNAWLQDAMKQPLGQGFVGPWAGFFGTKGEDVAATFKGEVLAYASAQLLNAPARVVWFGGGDSTSTPVLIVPQPAESAKAAFEALTKSSGHGVQVADRCPGDPPAFPDGGAASPARKIEIQRWVLANQALYASNSGGQIAIAHNPNTVLQGLCAKLPGPAHTAGADLDLTLLTSGLGHESRVLTTLLGVGASPSLAFAIEGDHLVPRGISGEVSQPGRVDVAPLSDELLKTLPVDAPVVLTAQLKLPASLDAEALKTFYAGKSTAPTVTRQVAVLWVPHGEAKAPTEVAIVWSRPEDKAGLDALLDGHNKLLRATSCNQLVFASTKGLLERIQKSCDGKQPALANAAAPVVAGLKQPASVQLAVQLGAVLGGVTLDAWNAESRDNKRTGPPPPEIDAAKQALEQLPTFGLTGTAQGAALVAGGFHS